jgi:predicted CxxxxCH...CXXCH cytochrome family protein
MRKINKTWLEICFVFTRINPSSGRDAVGMIFRRRPTREGEVIMTRPNGAQDDHDGFGGHRASWRMKGSFLALLAFVLVLVISVLKVPPATTGSVPCDCEPCHGDFHGANWQGCSGCHQSPPATGTHLAHYSSAPMMVVRYSDTTNRSTEQAYMFGCANCHPLDSAMHRNGTVDIELYNPAAPAESLKAKNPANAVYDPAGKTCGNIYCHSGISVASGPVPLPVRDPATGDLIYDPPYTVTIQRDYKTTPSWGTTGIFTTCAECHGFPPTTSYPAVQAGVGDSHQWIDDWGYADLHAWNMSYGGAGYAVPCATCHYESVNHYSGTGALAVGSDELVVYKMITMKNRSLHVNGTPNVAFDNTYQYPFGGSTMDLTIASYNAQTKTCTTVECHGVQQSVTWGSPYRYWNSYECDLCHGMMH